LNIGNVYFNQGMFKKALKQYEEARRIYTVCFGIEHERVARSWLSMSDCKAEIGDHEGALESAREAHRIYGKLGISSDDSRRAAELVQKLEGLQR
jgi:tetratricopeptide (TPR) repeat protein